MSSKRSSLTWLHMQSRIFLLPWIVTLRLFNSPSSSEWTNALTLAELLFSLPASNGKLEHVFSTLCVVKVDKCWCLFNQQLTGWPPTFKDPSHSSKYRFVVVSQVPKYKPRRSGNSPSTSTSQEDESEEDILECWDELMDTGTTDWLAFWRWLTCCMYLTHYNIFCDLSGQIFTWPGIFFSAWTWWPNKLFMLFPPLCSHLATRPSLHSLPWVHT